MFEVGDIIKCINAKNILEGHKGGEVQEGVVYTVVETDGTFVRVEETGTQWWAEQRFVGQNVAIKKAEAENWVKLKPDILIGTKPLSDLSGFGLDKLEGYDEMIKQPSQDIVEFSVGKIELNDGDILIVSIPPHSRHDKLANTLNNTFAHHGFTQRNITWMILSNEIKLGVIKSGEMLVKDGEANKELRLIRLGGDEEGCG